MIKVQIFDPAMCCSTGVCGPSVDPALPRFAADVEWLKTKGVTVERYNLAREVAAFTSNATVKSTLNAKGAKCLPLILVDGSIVAEGSYPTRSDLARFTRVPYEEARKILRVKEQSSLVTLGEHPKDGR
jgi:hypothetical protein